MITKHFLRQNNREIVQVTFSLPACKWSSTIHLVGDFNGWDPHAHPFRQTAMGDWSITIDMAIDQVYQFRYLCDGHEWLTDNCADGYVPNGHGSENCLVITKRDFTPHRE